MKKAHINLSDSDKADLLALLSQGSLPVRVYKRAQSLLYLSQEKSYQEVSQLLGVTYSTVSRWNHLYSSDGLSFLQDKARSGRPSQIDVVLERKITALACSPSPEGHSRWSLRLLADKLVELEWVESISHAHVGTILKKLPSTAP